MYLLSYFLLWIPKPCYSKLVALRCLAQLHYKYKISSLSLNGPANDFTSVELSELLGDVEAQSNTFGIQLLCRVHEPEQAKQAALVFFLYSDARIFDLYLKVAFVAAFVLFFVLCSVEGGKILINKFLEESI